eukprot:g13471.t1
MEPNSSSSSSSAVVQVIREWGRQQLVRIELFAYEIPMGTVQALAAIVRVHLGDGTVRVEAGEGIEYAATPSTASSAARMMGWETWSAPPEKKPARPPPTALAALAPGKLWYSVGDDDVGECVEGRDNLAGVDLANGVVVFREGLSMPKAELVRVVNTAHAVLALRGESQYFYLRQGFVLSAREEEALAEWGLGRPLFANSVLAMGGTLLVFFAEDLWRPGIVGTLLVAAAGYRVQGALTKMLRVLSPAWSDNLLVPSGIHGAERAVQGVLVTLVALADLLEDRALLLSALVLASAQVVVLESVGQAVLTWGFSVYRGILCVQLGVWASVCTGMAAFTWVAYVFAGSLTCLLCGIVWGVVYSWCSGEDVDRGVIAVLDSLYSADMSSIYRDAPRLVIFGAGIWAAVEGWNEADLKFSWRSLQPWRWPLFRAPGSLWAGFRVVGLWFGVVVVSLFAAYVVVGLLSFRTSSDTDATKPKGEKKRARKASGSFVHYHHDEKSIPSRNLLELQPSVVAAPVASVV